MKDTIERTIILPLPIDQAFRLFSEPEEFCKWFCQRTGGEFVPNGEVWMEWDMSDGRVERCTTQIVAVDQNERFAFTWKPGSNLDTAGETGDTLVDFRFRSVDTGTEVVLVESGFASLPASMREKAFKDNDGGWDFELKELLEFAKPK